jgi:phosphoenolpyruvate carboxykinase (ATP)
MLRERITKFGTPVWLVNTGWTGGPYGVGRRMPLDWTRTLVRAALAGTLDEGPFALDPVFGLQAATACPGVPREAFDMRSSWADPAAYDVQAKTLAEQFTSNFTKFAGQVDRDVAAAGPH